MKTNDDRKRFAGALIAVALSLAALPALAEPPAPKARHSLAFQGSAVVPWDGDEPGAGAALAYEYRLGNRHGLGAEIEYRRFETRLLKTENATADAVHVRFLYRFDLWRNEVFRSYVGAGVGLSYNRWNGRRLERDAEAARPNFRFDVPDSGAGIGALGLVGVEITPPRQSAVSLFTEFRASAHTVFIDVDDTSLGPPPGGFLDLDLDLGPETENFGAMSVHAGIRVRF